MLGIEWILLHWKFEFFNSYIIHLIIILLFFFYFLFLELSLRFGHGNSALVFWSFLSDIIFLCLLVLFSEQFPQLHFPALLLDFEKFGCFFPQDLSCSWIFFSTFFTFPSPLLSFPSSFLISFCPCPFHTDLVSGMQYLLLLLRVLIIAYAGLLFIFSFLLLPKAPLHERGDWKSWLKTQHSETKIMASGPITSWQIDGETMETVTAFCFGAQKSLMMLTIAMKLKNTCFLEEKLWTI